MLAVVYNSLLEAIADSSSPNANRALDATDNLQKAITSPFQVYRTESIEVTKSTETTGSFEVGASAEGVEFSAEMGDKSGQENKKTIAVSNDDKILFPTIHTFLSEVLVLLDRKLA